jgi:hypothetical protein
VIRAYFNETPLRVLQRRVINNVPAVLVEWPNSDRMWLDPSEVLDRPRSQGGLPCAWTGKSPDMSTSDDTETKTTTTTETTTPPQEPTPGADPDPGGDPAPPADNPPAQPGGE